VSVRIRRRCASPAEAERLRAAIVADNPSHVRAEVVGVELVVSVAPASAASARATVDDLLACLGAAERAVGPGPSVGAGGK